MKRAAIVLAGLVAACATAPKDAIQVMVVGSWHMKGSEADSAAVASTDVLTPERQAELAKVADALAAFRPTVVAVERITEAPGYVDPKFAAFTPAELTSNRDERVQLAYRLAARAGVTRVFGIDEQPTPPEPDYFPFDAVATQAAASGRQAELEAMIGMAKDMTARFSALQPTHTMGELLVMTNTDELSSADFYYRLFAFDAGEAQPGAELQAYWFMRNAKIFGKLVQVTKPGDRVVVVYGAGHKYWLDHFAAHTHGFASVDVAAWLKP